MAATPEDQRRYDLHFLLKKSGVSLDAKKRQINVPSNAFYTVRIWTWIRELQRKGYTVQITIPDRAPAKGKRFRYMGDRRHRQFSGQVCHMIPHRRPKDPAMRFVFFESGETCRVRRADLKPINQSPALATFPRAPIDYLNKIE